MTDDTPLDLGVARAHVPWRRVLAREQPAKAREVWKNGLSRYPDTQELLRRTTGSDEMVEKIVHDAVDPDTRVDTSLRGWLP